jgi:hypothetical protein
LSGQGVLRVGDRVIQDANAADDLSDLLDLREENRQSLSIFQSVCLPCQ